MSSQSKVKNAIGIAIAVGGVWLMALVEFGKNSTESRPEQPEVVAQPATIEPAPPEDEPEPVISEQIVTAVGEFSEDIPRGTAVVTTQDVFAALNSTLLDDVYSYADQGDQAAVTAMVDGNFPKAYRFPAGTQLVFEGCDWPVDTCPIVIAREQGSDRKMKFRAEDLAINR